MSLAVGKPTLIALACVLIFTAYSVMPVLQCMAEQKAIGEGYLGTLLASLFVFLVQGVLLFLVMRLLATRLLRKKAPPTNLTDYRAAVPPPPDARKLAELLPTTN